jgi:hypothetical protein
VCGSRVRGGVEGACKQDEKYLYVNVFVSACACDCLCARECGCVNMQAREFYVGKVRKGACANLHSVCMGAQVCMRAIVRDVMGSSRRQIHCLVQHLSERYRDGDVFVAGAKRKQTLSLCICNCNCVNEGDEEP